MDSARPGDPQKFLSLKDAALKLAVSVDVLLKWNEQNILKPTITPEGEVGYTEAQINHFIEIRGAAKKTAPLYETKTPLHNEPGRAEGVFHNLSFKEEKKSKPNLYQRFVHWVGRGFYQDDFIKDYFKSQVRQSLTFTFEKPSIPLPSRRLAIVIAALLIFLGGMVLTQQYQLKLFAKKVQKDINFQAENSTPNVLGTNTSKLKLVGRIVFRLP